MFTISVEDKFSSAHQLRGYKGKCENLHGHNWKVVLEVKGEKTDDTGMLIDFHDLKKILKNTLSQIDHTNINELQYFSATNPTAENLSRFIYINIKDALIAGGFSDVKVSSVTTFETDGCGCRYSE